MNFIKKWLTRREETKVHSQLSEMWTKADSLRSATPGKEYDPVDNFMTTTEANSYAVLAYRHFELCSALGEDSVFFSPRRHGGAAVGGTDSSPNAIIYVEEDNHQEVTFVFDEETENYFRYVNGARDEEYGQPFDRMVPSTYPRHQEFNEFYKKEMEEGSTS